tara:strand:+ start:697 stop:2235 length:1539 start_codon:yes stop_codon:yes gene_type:complete
MRKIKRALISLSNKKNLKKLLSTLSKYKINIISSGGTYKQIKKLKFSCTEVSQYTGFKEILGGRVKTLHPKIHGGILSKRTNRTHKKDLLKNDLLEIDLVIVNFYPFEKTLNTIKNHSSIIENIDIGGPTMVRGAAKNYNDVSVITDPSQYEELIDELNKHRGSTSLKFRQKMSEEAFSETAYYDSLISNYFNKYNNNEFPKKKIISANIVEKLRYGENPHQISALYSLSKDFDIKQINGKKLSYNNYNDIFSGLALSKTFPNSIGTAIIKHANPCGASIKKNQLDSFKSALACDPVSAFGGIVSCNYKIKKKLALEINKTFFEVIIANGFDKDSLRILKRKKKLRLIDSSNLSMPKINNFVSRFNSLLIQSPDIVKYHKNDFKVMSKKKPSSDQLKNLIFAFNVCKFVKSNAIVLASNKSTLGIGSGQPSRLDSCKIAIDKMKKFNLNSFESLIAASDAFFPFIDGFEKLVQAGISAIIQPSGSIKDKEIIKFANKTGTILVFSKTRHFRH